MAISHTECPLRHTTNNDSSKLSSMSGRGFRLERKDVESGMQMFVSSARAMDSCTFYIRVRVRVGLGFRASPD